MIIVKQEWFYTWRTLTFFPSSSFLCFFTQCQKRTTFVSVLMLCWNVCEKAILNMNNRNEHGSGKGRQLLCLVGGERRETRQQTVKIQTTYYKYVLIKEKGLLRRNAQCILSWFYRKLKALPPVLLLNIPGTTSKPVVCERLRWYGTMSS